MPKDMDELAEELESETKRFKRFNDERELKEARKGLIKPFANYPSETGHTMELKAEDRAFLGMVRGTVQSGSVKALVEDASGRQLISPAIDAELHRAIADLVVMRNLATVKQTEKDRVNIRSIDEVTASYSKLETGSEISESSPTPAEVTKYIEDINALSKFGIDLMEDSDHDLAAYIVDSFARALAKLENEKFLYGAGHDSGEPEGICVDATLVANAVETTAAGAITIEDCLDAVYQIPAQYRKGSSWIVNSLTELELRKLRAAVADGVHEGSFLWSPSVIAGAPNQFLGYPIYTDDNLGTLAGAAEVIAVFGNIRLGYQIYDRKRITVEWMRELYRESGLYGAILHARNTGFPIRAADKRVVLLKEAA